MVFNYPFPDGPTGLCSFSLLQMNFLVYSSLPISLGYILQMNFLCIALCPFPQRWNYLIKKACTSFCYFDRYYCPANFQITFNNLLSSQQCSFLFTLANPRYHHLFFILSDKFFLMVLHSHF